MVGTDPKEHQESSLPRAATHQHRSSETHEATGDGGDNARTVTSPNDYADVLGERRDPQHIARVDAYRFARDAGVRLAGGGIGTYGAAVDEDRSTNSDWTASTLPPQYSDISFV